LKAARHDADDGGLGVIELNFLADNLGIGAEAAEPKAVTEDGDRSGAGDVVFEAKVSAKRGRNAENGEEVRSDGAAINFFGIALAGEGEGIAEGSGGYVGENLIAGAPIGEVARSGSIFWKAEGGSVFVDDDEAVGVAIGKRAKEDGVGDAEDGGIGGNADSENGDGEKREAGILTEHAGAEADVLEKVFKEVGAAGVAGGFGEFGDATEIAESGAAGFGGGHAGGDVLGDLAVEMEAELVGEVGVESVLVEEREEPVEKALQAAHEVTP